MLYFLMANKMNLDISKVKVAQAKYDSRNLRMMNKFIPVPPINEQYPHRGTNT